MQPLAHYDVTTVDEYDPEWHRMWRVIRRLFGDEECLSESSGEVWGYLGTAWYKRGRGRQLRREAWHEFRHRDFPGELPASEWGVVIDGSSNRRVYVSVRADAVWAAGGPED